MEKNKTIRILMVEDQQLCRLGIKMSLADTQLPCELLGEAESVEQAVGFLKERGHELDIILLDYVLLDGTGTEVIEAARQLCPEVKIVLLSGEAGSATVRQLMNDGIDGYMNKNIRTEEFALVLASVMQGHGHLDERQMMLNPEMKADFDTLQSLTRREMEIITLCANGLSNKAIAEEMNITVHSVENLKSNLFAKLGVKSTNELILYAFRMGFVG